MSDVGRKVGTTQLLAVRGRGGEEGVASSMYTYPLGLARPLGFGACGDECSGGDVCIGVVVLFRNGDVRGSEGALLVEMLRTDSERAVEPRCSG